MIPDEFFDPKAPLNEGVRHRHLDCSEGKDRALIVTKTKTGWIWYCHRCGKGGFHSVDGLSPRQTLNWLKSLKAKPVQCQCQIELPKDFSTEIPSDGLAWLLKAGLEESDIDEYKIGYSRQLHRIIMPLYIDGKLVYWQGRSLTDPTPQNPKYMNIYEQKREGVYFRIQDGTSDVALVEDILSCIRVSKVMDAIALLYAYIPDKLVFELVKQYETVWFWLDHNKQRHMLERIKRYRSFGLPVKMVDSKQDPKYYSEEEIERMLENGG
jgi:hypothetical protein